MSRGGRPTVGSRIWLIAGLIVATVALAACSQEHSQANGKSDDDDPATLVRIEGTDIKGVVLTARATERLGIITEQVREVSDTGAPALVKAVPSSALIYDKNGNAWVYTTKQPRIYVRASVMVDRIEGDLLILESGPAPGTAVVTVGAAELLGVELGVGGG